MWEKKKIKTFTYFLNKNLALTLYTLQSLQKTWTVFGLNIRSYIVWATEAETYRSEIVRAVAG